MISLQDYEKLLETAIEKMPKRIGDKDRFQIPEVLIEIQGNKTLVRNFADIASKLRREPAHISKYLFRELATPGTIQGPALILQRKLLRDQIQEKVVSYVKNFVYCRICNEPDTRFVKDGRITYIQCDACGARSPYKSI